MLQAYDWPGNVRELEHFIQRVVIACKRFQIGTADLMQCGFDIADSTLGLKGRALSVSQGRQIMPLLEFERRYILEVLNTTNWRVKGPKGAAALLGPKIISPSLAKSSTTPATKGTSGPTTVNSTLLSRAKSRNPCRSSSAMGTFVQPGILAVPPFPGAAYMWLTERESANFQARTCSLAPEPIRRMFMRLSWDD